MLHKDDKIKFNPMNKDHVLMYGQFLKNGRSWKGLCPFKLEEPYESVPHMIEAKVTQAFCEYAEEGALG